MLKTFTITEDFGICEEKGAWVVYNRSRGVNVVEGLASQEQATEHAHAQQLRIDKYRAQSATEAATKAAKTAYSCRPVADAQAMSVAGLMGMPAPKATGNCHYCGQRLDRRGVCDQCS